MFKKHEKLFSVILTILFIGCVFTFLYLRHTTYHPGISLSNISVQNCDPGITEGKININTASAELMQLLPGIGEKLSNRIIEYRNANGPFRFTQDVTDVRGIGETLYGKIAPYITTGGIS